MKKIIILVSIFVSQYTFSQTETSDKPSSYISINGGYSKLMGDLIKTDYTDSLSGFSSSNGYNFGVEGVYSLTKYIGIGGSFSFSQYGSNGLDSLAIGYMEDFEVEYVTLTQTGKYNFFTFLVGPYFQYPFGKFSIEGKLRAGLIAAKTPKYQVDIEDLTAATFYQNSANSIAFASNFGLGLKCNLSEKLGLKLNADYTISKPTFEVENVNRLNNAGRLIQNYSPSISYLTLNLGVAYNF